MESLYRESGDLSIDSFQKVPFNSEMFVNIYDFERGVILYGP